AKDKLPPFIEPERYELTAAPAHRFELDRREFFKFLGGGMLVVCVLKDACAFQESGAGRPHAEPLPKEIGAWLHIGENDVVTVYTGKVAVGQNIRSSLTQAVAEELRVPTSKIQFVMADTTVTHFVLGPSGSRTTPTLQPQR